jgi:transcriptional regulator with XRE-family HTH domain
MVQLQVCIVNGTHMATKNVALYSGLSRLLEHVRLAAGFHKQQDLAAALNVKQQTVSRWEKGLSRPREQDLPELAQVLNIKLEELRVAAGYGKREASVASVATSFDRPLPLHALTPEGFERFCYFLLQRLYQAASGTVHPYGQTGHKQDGIDIYATGPFGIHSFQCKRVVRFGAQRRMSQMRNFFC